jgi:hypothetical protein
MYIAGRVPEDTPDPMLEIVEQLRQMPVPILGLVPQPHLEDWGGFGVQTGLHNGVLDEMTAALSYTLWRNPDDRTDPGNLADLDERTRQSLDYEPPWPRPQWILDAVARMRYPTLWDAVRTVWCRDPSRQDVRRALVDHVNHILVNGFGGSDPSSPFDRPGSHPLVDERSLETGFAIAINGAETSGVRIDTDPDVIGIGADLGAGGLLTAVIPRDDLPFIQLAFATRPLN